MYPLTLPSRPEQFERSKPRVVSFDCGDEYSLEHLVDVCILTEAETDAPNDQFSLHRWLEPGWPSEEQDEVAEDLIFDESSETCLV